MLLNFKSAILGITTGAWALVALNASAAFAEVFKYSYTSADPTKTSGSFAVSGSLGSYSLTAFSGRIGGVAYDASSVGIGSGSGSSIYLGGILNGVDYYANGTNDFVESGAFKPGSGSFSDYFQYSTLGSRSSGVSVSFTDLSTPPIPVQSYAYSFSSADPSKTSGGFTITEKAGEYSLAEFTGKIGGVSYDASTVGIASGSGGAVFLGGLLNGVDYYANGTNDFVESGAFKPGSGSFSDYFQYSVVGSNSSGVSVNFTDLSTPPVLIQSYTYTFSSTNPSKTSGEFTITERAGVYSLAEFSGMVGGVAYDTSTVSIASASGGAIFLGGLLNGVDYYANGTNDFMESGAFKPGAGAFSDFFQFSTVGSSVASGVAVNFTPVGGVPEPATWAMMVVGFGLLGGAMRRRPKGSAGVGLRRSTVFRPRFPAAPRWS